MVHTNTYPGIYLDIATDNNIWSFLTWYPGKTRMGCTHVRSVPAASTTDVVP